MVLRSIEGSNEFRVIGECYVYALDDCVTLIGPPPSNVRVQMKKKSSGYSAMQTYLDLDTGVASSEDPRLQPLDASGAWERVAHEWNADDPSFLEHYKNKWTGEVLNSDPRLLPSDLGGRGLPLRTFDLR
jgi:hypothetical protein